MNKLLSSIRSFAIEDDGAQVIEYALIIALVSIVLALALSTIGGTNMSTFITKVGDCLTQGPGLGTCPAAPVAAP
jgi:pilus assembly protein Flp/PilA